jgi:hypothetical protein
VFNLYESALVSNRHAPISILISHICIFFPTTIALNPPPLKLYNCANFTFTNINESAKGQGYAVLKLIAGPQHLSEILDTLTAGVAVAAGVAAEAVRRH